MPDYWEHIVMRAAEQAHAIRRQSIDPVTDEELTIARLELRIETLERQLRTAEHLLEETVHLVHQLAEEIHCAAIRERA